MGLSQAIIYHASIGQVRHNDLGSIFSIVRHSQLMQMVWVLHGTRYGNPNCKNGTQFQKRRGVPPARRFLICQVAHLHD